MMYPYDYAHQIHIELVSFPSIMIFTTFTSDKTMVLLMNHVNIF
jgi:hypothetical protein